MAKGAESSLTPPPPAAEIASATALAAEAPLPASSGKIKSGTAGWTDPTLLRSRLFYPAKTQTARARLGYYAGHFSLVEVDATYYSLMNLETVRAWCEATPDDFTFNVKAYPILTGHPIDVGRLPKDLKAECERLGLAPRVYPNQLPKALADEIELRFFESLGPLVTAGKLGALLVQYPPWFTATRGNVRLIEKLRERQPELPMAVEFRHKSWLEETRRARVMRLLTEQRLTYVAVDEPPGDVGGLPPTFAVTTPELAVVRFHGRNRAGWAKRGASVQERFNYLYSAEELSAWIEPLKAASEQARRVHAVFNNCVQNYAVLNAKGLVVLLGVSSGPC